MKLSSYDIIALVLIILSFVFAFAVYPYVPDKIPIHWGINGNVNGYGSKYIGLFLFPLVTLGLYALLVYLPKIDPYRKNYKYFAGYFEFFKLAMVLFFLAIYLTVLAPMFISPFNVMYFFTGLMAVFFYYIGYILQFVKRNFFFGIRTPWTIASEYVWDRTHEIGSITFRINAVIIFLGFFSISIMFWVFICTILANVLFLFIYSYVVWRKTAITK